MPIGTTAMPTTARPPSATTATTVQGRTKVHDSRTVVDDVTFGVEQVLERLGLPPGGVSG